MLHATPSRAALTVSLGALLLLVTPGCGRTKVVAIDGSSTVFLLSAAVVEKYQEAGPEIAVVVSQAGTGGGFKKFAAGEIDVCDASRPITADEAAACKKAGIEFIELKVAYDGLAVVANPANDWCDSLTVEELKTIWRKESEESVTRWSDVNPDWPDEELKLYGPGPDSGTFDYFTEVINGKARSCRSDYSPSENDNALVTGVAGDKGSLCYFGYGYYVENREKLKLLSVDSGAGPVAPSPATVRDGSYTPLSRPLFIYVRTAALADPRVARFLKFYLEHAGEVAEAVGYVELSEADAAEARATLDEAVRDVSQQPSA
jgi:phosphate transport system substrate-binding protein